MPRGRPCYTRGVSQTPQGDPLPNPPPLRGRGRHSSCGTPSPSKTGGGGGGRARRNPGRRCRPSIPGGQVERMRIVAQPPGRGRQAANRDQPGAGLTPPDPRLAWLPGLPGSLPGRGGQMSIHWVQCDTSGILPRRQRISRGARSQLCRSINGFLGWIRSHARRPAIFGGAALRDPRPQRHRQAPGRGLYVSPAGHPAGHLGLEGEPPAEVGV